MTRLEWRDPYYRTGSGEVWNLHSLDSANMQWSILGTLRYAGLTLRASWADRMQRWSVTRMGGGRFGVGVMRPDGSGERLLTNGFQDESPAWSPNGRVILFARGDRSGRSGLWSVDISGLNERRIATPLDASDPAWSPLLP